MDYGQAVSYLQTRKNAKVTHPGLSGLYVYRAKDGVNVCYAGDSQRVWQPTTTDKKAIWKIY